MKILMVCLGNICRSPLAHGVMEHLAKSKGLNWHVDSAGTGSWHIGHAPDSRSIQVAQTYGIDISGQRARQFQPTDFDTFDRIFVMDQENLKNVLAMAKNGDQKAKVSLLLGDEVVPDPYWDNQLFEPVYQMIEQACERIIAEERP